MIVYLKGLLLFLVTLGGGSILLFFPSLPKKVSKILLTFGGSYLFSITLVHLLPDFFALSHSHFAGIYLILGFYIQVFLDCIGHGVAHSHVHTHEDQKSKPTSLFVLLFSLSLHSLLEGLLLGIDLRELVVTHHHHHHHGHLTGNLLFLGMILHKIPAAFSLTATLAHWGKKRFVIIGSLIVFALMTPLGWLIGHYAQLYSLLVVSRLQILAGVAAGGILHIASTILFESDMEHQLSSAKWVALGLGASVAILTAMVA
ncbi:MAG: ZIP family metal transporter [Bacteroidota bacterium]